MKIISDIRSIQNEIAVKKKEGAKIALVPTMGFLHDGHTSLIKKAVKNYTITVVSIFVNPTQFGRGEDFEKYPRDAKRDFNIIKKTGADYIFTPAPEDMYGKGFKTHVQVNELSSIMCGKYRPGHFDGVCTVVLKLFNIINPDAAYFGLKDYQQLLIIKKMSEDLNLVLKIHECPIIREEDGLAMSSRNRYLSEQERENSTVLYKTIKASATTLKNKDRKIKDIKAGALHMLSKNPYVKKVDYFDLRNPDNLEEIKNIAVYLKTNPDAKILIASAIWIGSTRLIDNMVV